MPPKKASSRGKTPSRKSLAKVKRPAVRRSASKRHLLARFSRWLDTVSPTSIFIIGLFSVATSIVHSLFIDIGSWYATLPKPGIDLNGWIFETALTIIFICATASAVVAWSIPSRGRAFIMWLFVLLGMVQMMWSMFFFGLHVMPMSFFTMVSMWILLWILILLLLRRSKLSAALLFPYLVWSTFMITFNGLIALNVLT